MATAHEHFVKAEWHLDQASGISAENPTFTHLVQVALVHATLAHAAALGANERPMAPVPSPRNLDPRANRRAAERRLGNKKASTVAPAKASE